MRQAQPSNSLCRRENLTGLEIEESAASAVFRQAADIAIGKRADELGRLSRAFGYDEAYAEKDWRADVNRIVELARANNIAPDALTRCAERSVEGFAALMSSPTPSETQAQLDTALRSAIDVLLARYPTNEGLTKGTAGSLDLVREIAARGGTPTDWPWSRWAKLSKARQDFRQAENSTLRALGGLPARP